MKNIYKEIPHPYGIIPLELIVNALKYFQPESTILDLGCGDGRNALFLASQGFDVTAIDKHDSAIEILRSEASKLKLNGKLDTKVADLSELKFSQLFNNIICNFVLHFLPEDQFLAAIKFIQENTSPDGINAISDFTINGPLHSSNITTHWLKPGELRQVYENAGWDILYYSEDPARTRKNNSDGQPVFQMSASIIARKIA